MLTPASNNMPKVKKTSSLSCYHCAYCTKLFKSARSLSLHQYHNRTRGCSTANVDSGVLSGRLEVVMSLTNNHDVTQEDQLQTAENDGNNEDNNFEHHDGNDDQQEDINAPFELTAENLKAIPGETDVVIHTVEQRVHVELLQLLEKAEAPDYLYKEILNWASRAKALKYDFTPTHTSRKAMIKDLQQHFSMHSLRPSISQIKLESIHERVPIVTFDFKAMLMSLLTDTKLMQTDNLVVNNITDTDGRLDVSALFAPYESPDGMLDEVLSGHWYKDTVLDMDHDSDCFVCPLIFYIDKTFIDPIKSRFNLEPFNFTLAIFNRKSRSKFPFWRTLGYIPEAPECSVAKPAQGVKARNYHTMLEFVLKGLIEIHENPTILDNFPLRIGNIVKTVNLRIPVAFIIADTQGADKLCGRYLVYNESIQRLHRSCMCSPSDATDTDNTCEWVGRQEMMEVIERNDKVELTKYSQQHIPLHAFRNIDFGSNPHGIYGATPNDILHGVKLGIIKYVLEIFIDEELNTSARFHLDKALEEILPHLKQGGNSGFPRMYFPNGICSLTNTTAEELVGMMFVTYLLCITNKGRNACAKSAKMTIARIDTYVELFERLLIFLSWISSTDGLWKINDTRSRNTATKKIKELVTFITQDFERKSDQNWNISKLHELMHYPKLIDMFGSGINCDATAGERMHIEIAKKTGRKTQKSHKTFTIQAANRLADRHVIDVAYKYIVEMPDSLKSLASVGTASSSVGSTFVLHVTENCINETDYAYDVSIVGKGVLANTDLESNLYPDLVEYLVKYFSKFDEMPASIRCCSEFADDDGFVFRAHHEYRASGFWHDWALTSYTDDSTEGFTNVPSKILCFLPDGIPGDNQCYVVCHPCRWRKKKITQLVYQWEMQPCSQAALNGIPYDVVPASSLFSHCLVVPDLEEPGIVYQVADKDKWEGLF